ncbi:hypothetical protein Tco_1509926 [Tanacetum coccineum]
MNRRLIHHGGFPGVTHTEVSSPFEDLSDIGSPRADDHEFLELPYMPEDPYLEAALQAPPSPDYVPGPEEPEQAPLLPDYVPESDHEADPEEDDDEDPEEDPIDYPADGGDDGDDEMDIEEDEDDDMDIDADEEDEDDEMGVEVDEEAEEEHPTPAYPIVVALPATAPSAEETELFETDESAATPPPHPAYRMTTRITILESLPIPAWSDEVVRMLAISSPPASPLSPWSSSPPQIPFPLSPPSPVLTAPPPSPIRSLGYRAATIRMRAEAAATSHSLPLPPPFILSPTRPDAPPPMPTSAPTSLPPLLLPSASHREDRPEVNLPPRKRLGIALGPGYEVGESSAAAAARPAGGLRADYGFVATMDREIRRDPERYVGYGITDSWDEIVETLQGAPVSTDTELGAHVRDFESMVRRDTDEIYTMLDDEQSQRQLLASRVNMLFRDRRAHAHTRLLMETEARMSREAWGRSMDASDLARADGLRANLVMEWYILRSTRETIPLQGLVTTLQAEQVSAFKGTGDDIARGSHSSGTGVRGSERVARECTYQDFMKCKPLYFKGTEGVVELTQWFERMETVFRISNCSGKKPDSILLYVPEKAWTDKYCPRNEMKKLEAELWNLKVIGTDVVKYNQRFQELALLCVRMFPEEADKIERDTSRRDCPRLKTTKATVVFKWELTELQQRYGLVGEAHSGHCVFEKIVRIPGKINLIIHGTIFRDGSTQKDEDKSEEKRTSRSYPNSRLSWKYFYEGLAGSSSISTSGISKLIWYLEAIRQRIYKTQFHRPGELRSRVECLLEVDLRSGYFAPIEKFGEEDIPKDCLQNSFMVITNSSYANVINSKSKQEHEKHLKIILELMKERGVYRTIHVDPAKIESIMVWASPRSQRRFRQILRGSNPWALPEECEDFIAYCDASKKGLGAVLMQREK